MTCQCSSQVLIVLLAQNLKFMITAMEFVLFSGGWYNEFSGTVFIEYLLHYADCNFVPLVHELMETSVVLCIHPPPSIDIDGPLC